MWLTLAAICAAGFAFTVGFICGWACAWKLVPADDLDNETEKMK